MCVVLQHHFGKGARCAPPLHPPGLWLLQGIEPIPEPFSRSPVDHSQASGRLHPPLEGASVLPQDPHGRGDFALPWTPSTGLCSLDRTMVSPMETTEGPSSPLDT